MKKKNNVSKYMSLIVCFIPFVISVIYYEHFPEMVATHWDLNGTPNTFMPKIIAAFGVPAIILAGHIIIQFILKRNKDEIEYSNVMEVISIWMAPILSLIIQSVIVLNVIAKPIQWELSIYIIVGILFILIGNYLPKSKPNKFAGIKLPWIMNNSQNWMRTNRFTGYLWMADGILIIMSGIFKLEWLFIISFIIMILPPIIYSLIISKANV